MKYAVAVENLEILSHYLSAAINQKQKACRANRVLRFASEKGRLSVVQFSLNQGVSQGSRDEVYGCTCLGIAIHHGQSNIVRYLLDAESDMSGEIYDSSDEGEDVQSLLQAATTSQRVIRNRLELVNEFALKFSSGDIIDIVTAQFEKKLTDSLTLEPRPLELLKNTDFLTAFVMTRNMGRSSAGF
ncbi:MAG: hypothetical protein Q9209_002171 [Squamulea sp. 1 TL-2023]